MYDLSILLAKHNIGCFMNKGCFNGVFTLMIIHSTSRIICDTSGIRDVVLIPDYSRTQNSEVRDLFNLIHV